MSTAPLEPLVTAREAAAILGVQPATVLDWFEARRLPGFKVGGRAVRFRPSELEAWLEESRRGPGDNPAQTKERNQHDHFQPR